MATLNWEKGMPPISEWLFYCNNAIGITGLPGLDTNHIISWAIKFVPEDLAPYHHTTIKKVAVFILSQIMIFIPK